MYNDKVPPTPFKTILNFRDVGETVNALTSNDILKPHLFYRSGELTYASSSDITTLSATYKIQTILDFRSKSEHQTAAKKLPNAPHISDAKVHEISLTGSAFEKALFKRLSYPDMARLIFHLSFSARSTAISVLGKNVMTPIGLRGLGALTLRSSGPEIRDCFEILSQQSSYPVVVHCTQGKDRTGLIVMLVLWLCKVDLAAVDADYRASERELVLERAGRLKELANLGLSEEFAGCPEGFVEWIYKTLSEGWCGVDKYLSSIGVTDEMMEGVRKCLMTDTSGA